MAEQETQAASSPAPTISLGSMTGEQRDKWLLTGELPEVSEPEKAEDSAPSETPKEAKPETAEKPVEPVPAPEAGKQEIPGEKRESPAEKRKAQLAAEIQDLLRQRAQLRGEVQAPKVEAKPEVTAEKPHDPTKPTPESFATYEEYVEALSDWKVSSALKAEQQRVAEEARKAEAKKQGEVLEKAWKGRVAEATKRHPDFAEVALDPDLPIPQGSVIDAFLLESEQGAEMLYHLATHRDEIDRISVLNPIAQARELFKIENSLTPQGAPPPAKKVTNAPPPPVELGSGKTVPEEEEASAVKEGDFARYQAVVNARELAASRRG